MTANGNGQEKVWYFAYGLPLDSDAFERAGIAIYDTRLGRLENYRLDFNVLEDEYFRFERRGVANIMPHPGSAVEGVLYRIDEEQLGLLDRMAGVPSFRYYRKMVPVHDRHRKTVQTFVHAGWPDVMANGLRPSRGYLQKLSAAAQRFGFSSDYLQWLKSHPTEV